MPRELPLPTTLRRLGRRPAFLALAVTTLGLGIGAAVAMFAVVEAVLLRPLPYPQPERLVTVWSHADLPGRTGGSPLSVNEAMEYRQRARAFTGFAAFGWQPATLLGGAEPRQVVAAGVMQPFFGVMGVAPVLGRGFLPAEDAPGRDEAVVLGHALWQGLFAGDRAVLGRKVVVDGRPRVVVGVMPAGYDYPGHCDLWVPLAIDRAALDAHSIESHGLNAVARLRPGVTMQQAEADLDRVVRELRPLYPGHFDAHEGPSLPTLERTLVGSARTPLLSLLAAVGFLLLLACANVANLLLLRAQERRRELAVRGALGASPWQLLGQLFGEAMLLALLAGVLGTGVARVALTGVRALLPLDLPRAEELAIDVRVLLFALLLSTATALLVSLAPAWWMRPGRSAGALRTRVQAPRSGRLADGLLVGQVALALMLATGAALAGRSLGRLASVDSGFDASGVLSARVALPDAAAYKSEQQVRAFYEALQARLEADPRVAAVGAASWIPYADYPSDWPVEVEGFAPPPGSGYLGAEYTLVVGDYLRAIGSELVAGRLLRPGDDVGLRKAVVTQSFVARYFAGREPLGGIVRMARDPAPYEVVGVVADQLLRGPAAPARPGVFLPLVEIHTGGPFLPRALAVMVKTRAASGGAPRPGARPEAMAGTLRRIVRQLDPQVPLAEVRTFDDIRRRALGEARSLVGLLSAFALLGLVVGGVGSFAVAAAWVARGRRDIGVRMALGAARRRVVVEVIGRGARLTVLGCLLGSIVAVAAARAVRARLLFQVAPGDPTALGLAALVLLAVGLLATLVPARRAAAVQPMRVLREE